MFMPCFSCEWFSTNESTIFEINLWARASLKTQKEQWTYTSMTCRYIDTRKYYQSKASKVKQHINVFISSLYPLPITLTPYSATETEEKTLRRRTTPNPFFTFTPPLIHSLSLSLSALYALKRLNKTECSLEKTEQVLEKSFIISFSCVKFW